MQETVGGSDPDVIAIDGHVAGLASVEVLEGRLGFEGCGVDANEPLG